MVLQRILKSKSCKGYFLFCFAEDTPHIFPNYPFLYNVFFVSVYFVHQVKLVEERNMKPLDSNLAALSARCSKYLELNLAKSFLSEMGQCTNFYPYNSCLEN
ncbi:pentatricopeptide repeat-containing protein At1g76280-like [Lactuca sativa]|uniref:pentatricopeptide repeat-containing protein At1g76280-like n=1 Tax=Lactuca sativa TaxID=4236 RepID=UPI0022B0047C|nr:pentatricopeptide repeat-containing protein At1g76280-like [Lactuca sativa]